MIGLSAGPTDEGALLPEKHSGWQLVGCRRALFLR